MKNQLKFLTIVYDSQNISEEIVNFMSDEGSDGEPSARQAFLEDSITKWLFDKKKTFIQLIYLQLGISPDYTPYFSQTDPFTVQNRKPGDIDIILHSKNINEKSIAIECKRVIAKVDRDGNESINKVGNLYSGVLQANALYELGFYQTYLMIIVITDGRYKTQNNMSARGLTRNSFDKIISFDGHEKLNVNIGLVVIEVIQNVGRSIDLSGSVGVYCHKEAIPQAQLNSLTHKLTNFVNIV